jgi:hypothetical protein
MREFKDDDYENNISIMMYQLKDMVRSFQDDVHVLMSCLKPIEDSILDLHKRVTKLENKYK